MPREENPAAGATDTGWALLVVCPAKGGDGPARGWELLEGSSLGLQVN